MNKNAVLEIWLEKPDMVAAARVAQCAALAAECYVLQEIFLVDAKISRDPMIESPEALSLEHKCDTEILEVDKEKDLLFIRCNFRVAAFNGEEPSKLVMKIEAAFCTSYVGKPDTHMPDPDIHMPDDDDSSVLTLLHMLRINPISHAWPYWREFVQSMSARMGYPALTVPMLEIVLKKTPTKKAKSQPVKKQATRRKKVNA
jgi:hypothetical protein